MERIRNPGGYFYQHGKVAQEPAAAASSGQHDLGPKKTLLVLVIVVGCFAVLWPKVFYPMLVGSAQQHIKPSPIDRTTGCCTVISESDVNTIKIMSELCKTIISKENDSSTPLSGKQIIAICRKAVLETCGIDISAVLQEQVRLGQSTKQIIDEIRSLNGSLCLKYNFGVSPGTPHRVTVRYTPTDSIRQERPPHLRSEMVHPAFRERGRAIPQTQGSSPSRPPPRIVEGRPGPIPGMRPTIGGAGHVVPSKQGAGTMGLIMPVYTIGIVIFFTYTVMKLVFKKQPESLYPPVEPDPMFRREVFEANRGHKPARENYSNKLVVNAMSALLDEVDQEMATRRRTGTEQDIMANGKVHHHEDQGSVKVLGMEMRASCEGGQKWTRPGSPVTPVPPPPVIQPSEPPQEIYLEGSLPPQSNHLLVADSATEAQKESSTTSGEDPAVVLAGKMTLSVISLDSSENGVESEGNKKEEGERSGSNTSEDFEKIDLENLEKTNGISKNVEEILSSEEQDDPNGANKTLPIEEASITTNDDLKNDEKIEILSQENLDVQILPEETIDNKENSKQDELPEKIVAAIKSQLSQETPLQIQEVSTQDRPHTEENNELPESGILSENVQLQQDISLDTKSQEEIIRVREEKSEAPVVEEKPSEEIEQDKQKPSEAKIVKAPSIPTTDDLLQQALNDLLLTQPPAEEKQAEIVEDSKPKQEILEENSDKPEPPSIPTNEDLPEQEKPSDLFKRGEDAMEDSYRTEEGSENVSESDRLLDEILSEEAQWRGGGQEAAKTEDETERERNEEIEDPEEDVQDEEEEEEEEIEYEYEESGDEELDEEIRDLERSGAVGAAAAAAVEGRVNGIHGNEENSEDEDGEEIQEVVEYISDEDDLDEEEEIEENEVDRANNSTHD